LVFSKILLFLCFQIHQTAAIRIPMKSGLAKDNLAAEMTPIISGLVGILTPILLQNY
jgi:hypothetical protein